tara:strand:- start:545 stop:1672 length:1128 start_codon:yes stop_codon:yes gene_type:complete
MFNINDFRVTIDSTDISAMVTSMSLYESIHGNLKGTLHVEDNLNFFDVFFKGLALNYITISYYYFDTIVKVDLYANGITDQVITKQGKSYNIDMVSINNLNSASTRICNAFSGTSNDILSNLWKETNPEPLALLLDSETTSTGKYVVPNISSANAMDNVVSAATDKNDTPMFLYQRLVDNGATRFTSLYDMISDEFSPGFKIHSNELTIDTANDVMATIGSTANFALVDYNKDFIKKLSGGMWGQKITQLSLDETTNEVLPLVEVTAIEKTVMTTSANLYDEEASLFAPTSVSNEEFIKNMKYRVFNTTLSASQVVAIPELGCGMSVEVSQGAGDFSFTKTDGFYLVANINHLYIMDDGKMQYQQTIGLVREGNK